MSTQKEFSEIYSKYQESKKEAMRLNARLRCKLNLVNEKIETILTPELTQANQIEDPIGISFVEVSIYEVGQREEIVEGVFFQLTKKSDKHLQFLTYLMEGKGYFKHYHEDCFEMIKVVKGNLIERTKNTDSVLIKGESIMYAPSRVHSPMATKESIWEVNLYKMEVLNLQSKK